MSTARYPKRRRVSEKIKETTPRTESPAVPDITPEPQQESYVSSPDELSAITDHQRNNGRRKTSQPSRAHSQPKRGRKSRRKIASEKDAVSKTDPNQPVFDDDDPGASSDELNASPRTTSNSVTKADPHGSVVGADAPGVALLESLEEARGVGHRKTPDCPAISPLSVFDNHEEVPDPEETPDVEEAPIVEGTPDAEKVFNIEEASDADDLPDEEDLPDPEDSPDAGPFNSFQNPSNTSPDGLPPVTNAEDGSDEPATADTEGTQIPKLIRSDTNTVYQFRGSFSQDVSRQLDERYFSASPPPYSRISTPIATPRELPTRPPQYLPYRQKMVLRGHKRGVATVRFSPNGRLIASCSADATIRIWDTATGKHLHTLEGHLAGISTIAWAPDSKTLASGSDDKSIRLWDVTTGKAHPHPLVSHSSYVYALSFSPRGNILASGSYDEALFLWDVRTTRIMRSLPAHSDPIGGVDFIHDGTLIVSCSGDGLIRIWDTATGQCLRTLVHEDNAAVTSVRFSPNGNYVLAWTLDSSVRLWNYKEGRCVKTYQGHKNEKYSLGGAFGVYQNEDKTEKRAFVVSGSEDGEIVCWDVQSKEILQRMKGPEGVVLGVDTSKQGGLMVSGGLDKTVRIWERYDGTEEAQGQQGESVGEGEDKVTPDGAMDNGDQVMVNGKTNHHTKTGEDDKHTFIGEAEAMDMDVDVVQEIEEHIVNTV